MSEKKKRIRKKIGQVFQVPLGDGEFGYGQVVDVGTTTFFDYKDDGKHSDISKIMETKPLFYIGVADYAIKDGLWPVLGVFPVDPKHQVPMDSFTYDTSTKKYTLWAFRDGKHQRFETTPEAIQGLECVASWGPEHVERRLRDYFAGRPNYSVEYFRSQHLGPFPGVVEFYKKYGYDFKLPKQDKE